MDTQDDAASPLPRSVPLCAVLGALDAGFFLALLAAPAAWLLTPLRVALGPVRLTIPWNVGTLAAPAVLLALRIALKSLAIRRGVTARGLWEAALFKKLAFAVASTFLFFFAVEQVLELAGFEAPMTPIVIQGQQIVPSKTHLALVKDPVLRWRFIPGADFNGRPVNNLGFLDREVDPVKKPGSVRVICLGDSCTGQGEPPYSGFLHRLLTNRPPTGQPWEAFNMGVHGYSVVQGIKLFHMRAEELEPDIVTLYFGWNDHWLGGRLPDSKRMADKVSPFEATLYDIVRKKRFGQLVAYLLKPEKSLARSKAGGFRVPPDEYRDTLRQLIRDIRAAGAVPVLITAPRAETLTKILIRNRQTTSVEEAIRAHDEYVDIGRRVAAEENAFVLDLARLFAGPENAGLFAEDGIHLEKVGRIRVADELYRTLEEIVRSPPWRERRAPGDARRAAAEVAG